MSKQDPEVRAGVGGAFDQELREMRAKLDALIVSYKQLHEHVPVSEAEASTDFRCPICDKPMRCVSIDEQEMGAAAHMQQALGDKRTVILVMRFCCVQDHVVTATGAVEPFHAHRCWGGWRGLFGA